MKEIVTYIRKGNKVMVSKTQLGVLKTHVEQCLEPIADLIINTYYDYYAPGTEKNDRRCFGSVDMVDMLDSLLLEYLEMEKKDEFIKSKVEHNVE